MTSASKAWRSASNSSGCVESGASLTSSTLDQVTRSRWRLRLPDGAPAGPGQHRSSACATRLKRTGRIRRGARSRQRVRGRGTGFRVAASDRRGQRHVRESLRVGTSRGGGRHYQHERLGVDRAVVALGLRTPSSRRALATSPMVRAGERRHHRVVVGARGTYRDHPRSRVAGTPPTPPRTNTRRVQSQG